MPIIIPANTLASGGFEVDNSCRFDGTSAYLHKTPTNAGNRLKYTFSTWVKKSKITGEQIIFTAYPNNTNHTYLRFKSTGEIRYRDVASDSTNGDLVTSAKFRDPSAWYHVVLVVDEENGTSGNRLILYVNGLRVTEFGTETMPTAATTWNSADVKMEIGVTDGGDGDDYFSGYMAETVFIDGSALTPTDFGEFDEDSGIWKPINVSGLTFGTNGFYLDFEASGNLGNDASGGTDFTEVNLAATDQTTDTCTNNFATMLPLTKSTDATLSEGNLNVTYGTASTRRAIFGSIVVTAGKWFCETKIIATSQTSVEMNLGISNTYDPEAIGNALISTNGFTVSLFPSNGSLYIGSTRDEQGLGNLAVNDIIGMAINIDDGTLQFYKNGSALGSANDITTGDSDDGELYPGFTIANSCSSGGQTFTASHNFGSPAYSESGGNSDASGFGNFSMSVPSGFFSICTKNLAEYGG